MIPIAKVLGMENRGDDGYRDRQVVLTECRPAEPSPAHAQMIYWNLMAKTIWIPAVLLFCSNNQPTMDEGRGEDDGMAAV